MRLAAPRKERKKEMGDDRNRILDLLAAGKITAEEAARLLDALDAKAGRSDGTEAAAASAKSGWSKFFASAAKSDDKDADRAEGAASVGGDTGKGANKPSNAKFLFVKVVSTKGENVNVKIPLGVVRAGLKLTTLIPKPATDQINKSMAEKGMSFDLNSLKPEDLQELIDSLAEMEIEVDANNGDTVRVYAA